MQRKFYYKCLRQILKLYPFKHGKLYTEIFSTISKYFFQSENFRIRQNNIKICFELISQFNLKVTLFRFKMIIIKI